MSAVGTLKSCVANPREAVERFLRYAVQQAGSGKSLQAASVDPARVVGRIGAVQGGRSGEGARVGASGSGHPSHGYGAPGQN
jgi:hypothetical protein